MSEIVTSDGVRIAYDVWGQRDGTPVLLIQGLGMNARGWALQRGAFGRRHRCIAVDNRGTGHSDAPDGPYDLVRMASDAVEVLDAAGIERAHVVGASMGGVIAQIIGVLHPDRVQSLVLACTACRHHKWRRELLAEWAELVTAHGMQAMTDDGMRWLIGPRLQRRFGVFMNVLARVLVQTKPAAFAAQVEAILAMPDDMRNELHTIAAPTLVITGSQDTLTPLGDAEEMAELISGSRLYVLRGAAHGLMAEAPNAFNDAVLRFIDAVDLTTPLVVSEPPDPAVPGDARATS
jgi:3-oxoadipate enol-lactonase